MKETGFTSIVQYQPDAARQEAANVGLVLFCPAWGRIDVRMTTGMGHVQRFFGRSVDGDFLADMKRAFEGRLRAEGKGFHTEADLTAFARRLGNDLKLTEPRGVAMTAGFDALLEDLYLRLVAEPKRDHSPRSGLGRKLRAFFDRIPQQDRVSRKERIELPKVEEIEAPYAYLNETLHLVKPIALGDKAKDEARSWFLVDQVLKENAHRFEKPPRIEVVLARADSAREQDERAYCEKLLAGTNVALYSEERFDEFEHHVMRQLAHP